MTDVARLWYAYAIAATVVAVGAVALMGASTWYGRPFPSAVFSPEMVVSSLSMPAWVTPRQKIAFPDRVMEVDGIPLNPVLGHEVFNKAVAHAVQQGHGEVRVRVQTHDATTSVVLPIIPFPTVAWWWLAGGLLILGFMYAAAGIVAVVGSPRGKLARSFFAFAMLTALFGFTYFDFLTSQSLVPCFYVAFAMLPSSLVILPLRLPNDAWPLRRAPWLETVAWVVGALLAFALVSSHVAGLSTVLLRQVVWGWLDFSLVFFVATVALRFVRAEGTDRAVLRPVAIGLTPGLGILAWYAAGKTGLVAWDASSCLVPALALIPIAPLGACVRQDLWSSRSILREVALAAFTALATVGFGAGIATLLGVPLKYALTGAILTALVAGAIAIGTMGLRASHRTQGQDERHVLFERLTEQLTQATTREEVMSVIERTVRNALPCEEVAFIATSKDAARSSYRPTQEPDPAPTLIIRSLLHGRPAGRLRVTKRRGSTFSQDDVALLRTIANQATLALALVDRVETLDHRRREQAEAWEGERAAIIEALAAEIAHEVRYPINFFRSIFSRGANLHRLEEEDIDIGCEEVERLERLVADLRKVAVRRLERREVRVTEIIAKAEVLLRDRLDGRSFALSVPDDIRVRCDPDQIIQVLVNLMANAISATKGGEDIGIDWAVEPSGASLTVWDRGAGFVCPPSIIFTPWFTTKSTGTGLGLAITHRIVRAHGWAVDPERKDERTTFTITIPSSDVVADEDIVDSLPSEEADSTMSEEMP
jgi:signal transduction histidine kinase